MWLGDGANKSCVTAWLDSKQQDEEVQRGNEVTSLHYTGFREREAARVKLESH